ncbi:hypothetical protein DFA_02829 [Cavenderia fasciculata]|uniref:FNIP repeat-containing protein n=1 Tax=Cavenderia fasciculata TaxID=261658 RepID=F4PIK6_CACFS|nr:uncharacterized protein DFA_02829 [Cavenderia fasciculata]EGG24586.1 hypothetical protein DFA_02829 [Cavenderia fasciculata]|eukprot:XP_004362437.1 hypothetical protein DFA_02829 [Cavenderia fasciculata]
MCYNHTYEFPSIYQWDIQLNRDIIMWRRKDKNNAIHNKKNTYDSKGDDNKTVKLQFNLMVTSLILCNLDFIDRVCLLLTCKDIYKHRKQLYSFRNDHISQIPGSVGIGRGKDTYQLGNDSVQLSLFLPVSNKTGKIVRSNRERNFNPSPLVLYYYEMTNVAWINEYPFTNISMHPHPKIAIPPSVSGLSIEYYYPVSDIHLRQEVLKFISNPSTSTIPPIPLTSTMTSKQIKSLEPLPILPNTISKLSIESKYFKVLKTISTTTPGVVSLASSITHLVLSSFHFAMYQAKLPNTVQSLTVTVNASDKVSTAYFPDTLYLLDIRSALGSDPITIEFTGLLPPLQHFRVDKPPSTTLLFDMDHLVSQPTLKSAIMTTPLWPIMALPRSCSFFDSLCPDTELGQPYNGGVKALYLSTHIPLFKAIPSSVVYLLYNHITIMPPQLPSSSNEQPKKELETVQLDIPSSVLYLEMGGSVSSEIEKLGALPPHLRYLSFGGDVMTSPKDLFPTTLSILSLGVPKIESITSNITTLTIGREIYGNAYKLPDTITSLSIMASRKFQLEHLPQHLVTLVCVNIHLTKTSLPTLRSLTYTDVPDSVKELPVNITSLGVFGRTDLLSCLHFMSPCLTVMATSGQFFRDVWIHDIVPPSVRHLTLSNTVVILKQIQSLNLKFKSKY